MRICMKKLLKGMALLLCCSLICCLFMGASPVQATETNLTKIPISVQDAIIEEVATQNSDLGFGADDYSIVPLKDALEDSETPPASPLHGESAIDWEKGAALQAVQSNGDGNIKVTTLFPYTISDDGTLVNSFAYAAASDYRDVGMSPKKDISYPGATFKLIVYYSVGSDNLGTTLFYRHNGIEAGWTSTSSVNFSKLYVRYNSKGDLYPFPDCATASSLSGLLIQKNYSVESLINVSNPTKGYMYVDGKHTMPFNRRLFLSDFFEHKGLCYYKITYTYAGQTYNFEDQIVVYRKS